MTGNSLRCKQHYLCEVNYEIETIYLLVGNCMNVRLAEANILMVWH